MVIRAGLFSRPTGRERELGSGVALVGKRDRGCLSLDPQAVSQEAAFLFTIEKMGKILTSQYFRSRNTVKIAKSLLGKFLVRRHHGRTKAYLITEVEAYDGFKDKASHAHRGKTKRNKVMFGSAGHWYVYFTYGMHWMLNIVTGPKDYPAAILIRGLRPIRPIRPIGPIGSDLNGPARLTKALKIDKNLNGKLAIPKSGLWIEDRGVKIKPGQIKTAPRVGVAYAGPVWSRKKWRFYLGCC